MLSGPITSWQIDGEIVETVADFIFLGSKITADGTGKPGILQSMGSRGVGHYLATEHVHRIHTHSVIMEIHLWQGILFSSFIRYMRFPI